MKKDVTLDKDLKRQPRKAAKEIRTEGFAVFYFETLIRFLFSYLPAVQEGHNLTSGAAAVGSKGGGCHAVCNALGNGPQHCIVVICALGNVCEHILVDGGGSAGRTVNEGNGLTTVNGGFRLKGGGRHAVGYTLLNSPQHSFVIVGVCLNIGKGILCRGRLGAAHGTPQEGDGLSTGANSIG